MIRGTMDDIDKLRAAGGVDVRMFRTLGFTGFHYYREGTLRASCIVHGCEYFVVLYTGDL